jgi:hypothetical protein
LKILAALVLGLLVLPLTTAESATADEPNPVTAIDILLQPDATMVRQAEAANERLLKEFPRASLWERRITRTSLVCSGT